MVGIEARIVEVMFLERVCVFPVCRNWNVVCLFREECLFTPRGFFCERGDIKVAVGVEGRCLTLHQKMEHFGRSIFLVLSWCPQILENFVPGPTCVVALAERVIVRVSISR